MAKQNVTFVERHLEKIVLGATGTVFLATAIFYLVGTPHKVEVLGDSLGPPQLYDRIKQQADAALQMMKQAQPGAEGQPGTPPVAVPDVAVQRSPYEAEGLPKEFAVLFVPLAPEVPEIKGAQRGKIRLAEILPPRPLASTTGRAYAKLAPPAVVTDPSKRSASEALPAVTQDWNWVTVFSAVHRKEQRVRFDEAQYALERQHLIVAGVEAQRQERLPNGEWGPARIVNGYGEFMIPLRKTAELIPQDDGSLVVGDLSGIDQYKKTLEAQDVQAALLRPDLQKNLDFPLAWKVPAELPGLPVKWDDYGVVVPAAPEPRRPRGPLAAQPGQPDLSRQTPLQLSRAAEQAITDQDFLEAERLLKAIEMAETANSRQKEDARAKLRAIQPQIEQARALAAGRERRVSTSADLGPDVEPLWYTDLTVAPGRTYRYRLRLLAFNTYVGLITQLERQEDAATIVIEGNWSDWSEPVEVQPVSHLFFTTARADTGRIEMRDWFNGQWFIGSRSEVRLGDPIAFTEARHDFAYQNAVIVGLNPQITFQDKPAAALQLITADGQVEERITTVDIQRRKDLLNEIRETQKLFDEYSRLQSPRPAGERRPVAPPTVRPPARGGTLEDEVR